MKIIRYCISMILAILALATTQLWAESTISNPTSGWIGWNGSGFEQANNTTYSAGNFESYQLDNYFVFDLSGLAGTVTGATFNVESYTIAGSGGTFNIYATSLTPAEAEQNPTNPYYSALTSGALIGSIAIDSSDQDELLNLSLNSSGLSWLQANEGDQVVLGGAYSSPGTGFQYAFGYSRLNPDNALDIQTGEAATTPEPSSLWLLGSGLLGLAGVARRKIGLRA